MIQLFFALLTFFGIFWIAKKFYFPIEAADHPELYPTQTESKISKKELAILLSHLQRWRKSGRITREEYDHLTDICLSEMENPPKEP